MEKFNTQVPFLFILLLTVYPIIFSGVSKTVITDEILTVLIEGTVTPEQQYTYRLEPFVVPEGTGALEFTFDYEGRRVHSEMEIGLFDPQGFRGTSRFSKSTFYISKYRTTASYFPGPILEGEWNISLGFPTITQDASYTVTIRMIPENHPEYYGPSNVALNDASQWYRGDFHTHTGHSDAFGCHDTRGNRSTCQVWHVAEASHRNGLDFVSINDHNTVSHHQDIKIAQPTFPDLLLLRGQEVTTFYGHMNVIGTSIPVDFRIGFDEMTVNHIQKNSLSLGSLLVIAHPGRETGARCTGCGWSADHTDYHIVDAIEIVNGTNIETDISGIPFWHERLNEGYMITGIGGSDDHGGGFGRAQPGTPTTMVYAGALSESALLDAVRKGRVYLKTRNPYGPEVEFTVTAGDQVYEMGDVVSGNDYRLDEVLIQIGYTQRNENTLELILNSEILDLEPSASQVYRDKAFKTFRLKIEDSGWLRFNLRDSEGITIISNPIYFR